MEDKTSLTRPRQRLLAAAIAGLLAAAAAPAMAADSEIDALKHELAEQRKLIDKLLAEREGDKKAPAAPAASGSAVSSTPGVSIYGVLDGGYERISNVKDNIALSGAPASKTGDVTRMATITGTMASRVGLNASKEFQPGLKGIATAEAGFNLNDGTLGQGGRIFGRQLFAGLDTQYGAFTIGRQWSMMFYAMLDSDILGPNIYAMGSFDPYLPNMRYDNSIAWRAKFDKLSMGATYSTGRSSSSGLISPTSSGAPLAGNCAGQTADSNYCRGWSMMAKYDDANWGIAAAIDNQNGGPGASASFYNGAPTIALTRAEDTDRRTNVGGYYKFGSAKIGAGVLRRKVDAASGSTSSNGTYVGASYALTEKVTIDGGWNRMSNSDQDRDGNNYAIRAFYSIDKALLAYAQVGHLSNSSKAVYSLSVGSNVAPPAGGSQTGTMVGMRYRF